MKVAAQDSVRDARVDLGRLLWVGPLAIVLAVVANVVARAVAVSVFDISPEFGPLAGFVWPVAVYTAVGVLGASVVFAIVARLSRHPVELFKKISLVALFVSFVPNVMLLITNVMLETSLPSVGTLMLMHVVAWAISVYVLTTMSLRR